MTAAPLVILHALGWRRCRAYKVYQTGFEPGREGTRVRCDNDRNHAGQHRGWVGWTRTVTWPNVGDRGPRS